MHITFYHLIVTDLKLLHYWQFFPLGISVLQYVPIYFFQVVSRESLAALYKKQADRKKNNQNPWTFKKIVRSNMLGIRKVLSPFDLHKHGHFTGKFHLPGRVWPRDCHAVTPPRPHQATNIWKALTFSNILESSFIFVFLCKSISEFEILLKGYFILFLLKKWIN